MEYYAIRQFCELPGHKLVEDWATCEGRIILSHDKAQALTLAGGLIAPFFQYEVREVALKELVESALPSTTCPRCGKPIEIASHRCALSRRADALICEKCGTIESLEDFPIAIGVRKIPLENWHIFIPFCEAEDYIASHSMIR